MEIRGEHGEGEVGHGLEHGDVERRDPGRLGRSPHRIESTDEERMADPQGRRALGGGDHPRVVPLGEHDRDAGMRGPLPQAGKEIRGREYAFHSHNRRSEVDSTVSERKGGARGTASRRQSAAVGGGGGTPRGGSKWYPL